MSREVTHWLILWCPKVIWGPKCTNMFLMKEIYIMCPYLWLAEYNLNLPSQKSSLYLNLILVLWRSWITFWKKQEGNEHITFSLGLKIYIYSSLGGGAKNMLLIFLFYKCVCLIIKHILERLTIIWDWKSFILKRERLPIHYLIQSFKLTLLQLNIFSRRVAESNIWGGKVVWQTHVLTDIHSSL